MDAYKAEWIASTNASLSPSNTSVGPANTGSANTRSDLYADIARANTASAIVGIGTPRSKPSWLVHLPVPF